MEYRYKPEGVCSRELVFDIEGDIVKSVKVVGASPGNTVGISKLVEGMKIKDIIIKPLPIFNYYQDLWIEIKGDDINYGNNDK